MFNFEDTLRSWQVRPPAPRRRPLDVLVVADEPITLRGLELGLGHFGHLVFSVDRVSNALAHLAAFVVDAVVCDIRLAPDGGRRLLGAAWHGNPHVRAIGLSDDPIALLRTDPQMQFDRLLLKPVDCVELHRALSAEVGD